MKRLSETESDGDRIRGVIRGSAVNHGGASTGLTVPHTPALEKVIETALARAGINASEVDYLEAHGTGTGVDDPIELNAVGSVYGKGRSGEDPLLVGLVKTNIGHLESAAGIAGLIKAVLVMQRGVITRHLHFESPTPAVDWSDLPLRVTSSMMDLPPRAGRPRVAGVNSFGISGTNAHLVVEEYCGMSNTRVKGAPQRVAIHLPESLGTPADTKRPVRPRGARILPLSGKSSAAVRDLAARYLLWMDEHAEEIATDGSGAFLADMAWTAGVGRSHFAYRSAIVFNDAASLQSQLQPLAESGGSPKSLVAPKVAFASTGQGSQWAGIGQVLYEREPVARAVLDRCEEVFQAERNTSLLDAMFGRSQADLSDTAWEQPALYALECALTALWAGFGIRPPVVVGHSVGELVAAQAAGVFSLEDGMRFACVRGMLLSATDPGAMAAVFASPARVAAMVNTVNASTDGVGLSISADNGTHQVVSGPIRVVESIQERFESEGTRVRRLNTARAFHSAMVEPALESLEASLEGVVINSPQVTVVSNLTGRALERDQLLDGAYWRQHARNAVAFASGVRTMADLGVDVVLEIGPRPVLTNMVALAWPESSQPPAMIPGLHVPSDEGKESGADFMQAVAQVHSAGLPLCFEALFAGETRRRIALPGYPFQRERYWIDAAKRCRPVSGHPLLGLRHASASGEITFETEVFPTDPA
ncbi:MAG: type I polyketide synthase [Bacteroidota bacterium]|nr:type I polyketide synthase [Bacteroidota bacterium]